MAEAQAAALPLREYETIYVLRPDLTKATLEKVAARVDEVVGREGGKMTLVENWGRRALAYPIQHQKRGVYVYVKYLGDGALVAEIERNFRMLDEVMRFQTVKVSEGIDPGSVTIDSEALKFEAEDPPAEEEDELTYEQQLGLVDSPRSHDRGRDRDMDEDDYEDDE